MIILYWGGGGAGKVWGDGKETGNSTICAFKGEVGLLGQSVSI